MSNSKYIHPVSGEIKPLSRTEFLKLFDESVHTAIERSIANYPDCEAVVCFENLDMSSSQLGHRTACVVGPSNTWSLDYVATAAVRLGDVPSRFQYPVSYWKTKQTVEEALKVGA